MATLNWKTPNGTTGSLNLANIVLTNTSQTIAGTKTFTQTINHSQTGNSNNEATMLRVRSYNNSNSSLYTDTYINGRSDSTTDHRTDFRTTNQSGNYAGLQVHVYGTNGDKSRFLAYTNNSKTLVFDNADCLTTRGFVGALGGVTSLSNGANGYIQFKSGLIIQWGNVTTASGASASNYYSYAITFPIAFPTVCTALFSQDYDSGTPDTMTNYSTSWYPNVPKSGSNIKASTIVSLTRSMAAIHYIAIGW